MLQKQTHPRAQRWAVCPKTRGNLSLCPRRPPWRIKDNHLSSAHKQTLHLDLLQTQCTLTWSGSSWGGRRHLWQRCKSFCHKSPPWGQKHSFNHQSYSNSSTLQIVFSFNERAVEYTNKHTPWCKRFCLGTWCISPDTRSSTSDSTTGTWCTYFQLLMDRGVNIYTTLETSLPGHPKDAFRRSCLLENRFMCDLWASIRNTDDGLHQTVIKTEADLSACGPDTPAEPWWSEWLRG